ncbi:MAG: hypothetical protein AAF587_39675, partial [Bacteroidota bacterium]
MLILFLLQPPKGEIVESRPCGLMSPAGGRARGWKMIATYTCVHLLRMNQHHPKTAKFIHSKRRFPEHMGGFFS